MSIGIRVGVFRVQIVRRQLRRRLKDRGHIDERNLMLDRQLPEDAIDILVFRVIEMRDVRNKQYH